MQMDVAVHQMPKRALDRISGPPDQPANGNGVVLAVLIVPKPHRASPCRAIDRLQKRLWRGWDHDVEVQEPRRLKREFGNRGADCAVFQKLKRAAPGWGGIIEVQVDPNTVKADHVFQATFRAAALAQIIEPGIDQQIANRRVVIFNAHADVDVSVTRNKSPITNHSKQGAE